MKFFGPIKRTTPAIRNIKPFRTGSRDAVYRVIDGERDYQTMGKGNAGPARELMMGEGIAVMEEILAQARTEWYKADGTKNALPYIRKVAAVAVQLMERYGAVPREGHVP